MLTIDAHQHVWNLADSAYDWLTPAAGILYRDYSLAEFRREAETVGVHASVLVQADDDPRDTESMRRLASTDSTIVGIVASAPLHRPREIADALRDFGADPLVVGIRNLTHDRPDTGWMARREYLDGVELAAEAGLAIDLVGTRPEHFDAALAVIRAHPAARIVLDHLMKPPLGADLTAWRRAIDAAAEHPNVTAKVSGLTALGPDPAHWTDDQVAEVMQIAMSAFGAPRLMFGGDWPVVELAGGYARAVESLRAAAAELSSVDAARFWGGTAAEVYRIDPARVARVPR